MISRARSPPACRARPPGWSGSGRSRWRWRRSATSSEQPLAPHRHAGRGVGIERLAAETKNDVSIMSNCEAVAAAALHERAGTSGRFHEAVVQRRSGRSRSRASRPRAARSLGDVGNVARHDGEEHDALVQHLVVLQVVQQRVRHAARRATVRKTAVPWTRGGGLVASARGRARAACASSRQLLAAELAAALPGRQQREDDGADERAGTSRRRGS